MRCLITATIPVEAGNALVSSPDFSDQLETLLGTLKPEQAYFAVDRGQRTMWLVVNIPDASRVPSVVEPLWLLLKAEVSCIPVMDRVDMAKATSSIREAAKRFGPPRPSRRQRVTV